MAPEVLARKLAILRNLLRYEILRDSIAPALDDFGMFVSIFSHSTGD